MSDSRATKEASKMTGSIGIIIDDVIRSSANKDQALAEKNK